MTKNKFEKFFKNFRYLDHKFEIEFTTDNWAKITKSAILIDVTTGKKKRFSDSRSIVFRAFNEFELLNHMRNWLTNLAIHENDERIVYKGKRVFDPHKSWSHTMER